MSGDGCLSNKKGSLKKPGLHYDKALKQRKDFKKLRKNFPGAVFTKTSYIISGSLFSQRGGGGGLSNKSPINMLCNTAPVNK